MPKHWTLPSIPPHDFFLCLDLEPYFDHEHNPETVYEAGFTRSVPLVDRDVLVNVVFNGDPEHPEFHVQCRENLDEDEVTEANKILARILGTELDLKPLYEQAADDPVLAPMFSEYYGLKRMARANFFEDAINRVIQTQIQHKPTARKMVYEVRQAFSARLEGFDVVVPAWPRPEQLVKGDPVNMKKHGLSLRKGEYLVGLAEEYMAVRMKNNFAESLDPQTFYDIITTFRGIGPTTAQDLMLFRNRPDAVFPSRFAKGQETGLRKWIILSYGGNPDTCPEQEFLDMISNWEGYEALALEHLFANWMISWKRKKQ